MRPLRVLAQGAGHIGVCPSRTALEVLGVAGNRVWQSRDTEEKPLEIKGIIGELARACCSSSSDGSLPARVSSSQDGVCFGPGVDAQYVRGGVGIIRIVIRVVVVRASTRIIIVLVLVLVVSGSVGVGGVRTIGTAVVSAAVRRAAGGSRRRAPYRGALPQS